MFFLFVCQVLISTTTQKTKHNTTLPFIYLSARILLPVVVNYLVSWYELFFIHTKPPNFFWIYYKTQLRRSCSSSALPKKAVERSVSRSSVTDKTNACGARRRSLSFLIHLTYCLEENKREINLFGQKLPLRWTSNRREIEILVYVR